MSTDWSKLDQRKTRRGVDAWILFGITAVVAVAAILTSIGLYVIRSTRADQLEREIREARVEANTARRDADDARARAEAAEKERDELRRRVPDAPAPTTASNTPSSTPAADQPRMPSLREMLGANPTLRASVAVEGPNLDAAAISRSLREKVASRGLHLDEMSPNQAVLSVVSVDSGKGQSALSVSLEVTQPHALSTQSKQPIVLWHRHTAGLTTVDRIATTIDQLTEDLLAAMSAELQRNN